MDEKEMIEKTSESESKAIHDACKALQGYDKQIKNHLAQLVASLCGVSYREVMEDTTKVKSKHARWLYWYAYKMMTNESCEAISRLSRNYRYFHTSTVTTAIAKMSMMISEEPIWKKRWSIIKRVINEIQNNGNRLST